MRILIVEDDPMLGDGLQRGLKLIGHAVDWFGTAAEADRAIGMMHYDAVVLDLGLPDDDGVALLGRWRQQGRQMPVVVLTARDAVASRISGLDAGADDYLVKPVELDELAARLRAVTRRAAGMPEPVWRHGPLEYQPAARLALWHGKAVDLTSRESMLLELLLTYPNRVLTREFLRDKLYDWDKGSESNTLEVHIHHLRKKLHPGIVRTLRGAGYTLGTLEAIEIGTSEPEGGDRA
ncbi:two-component system, OmpR family, response regulator QseB [Cupriavidus metallidurans]|jgi:two-component system, OmpR family, response regulator QseB|uniref:DNA-binding response regulator in two-component regulatory system with QseC n=2 Tax=Cupriavidus metallidurans TaxID=119219 RepID=Q1LDT5_CUPMC|nr:MULTISPECIES: response regulator [Cupriavidus]ABF11691.1 DNA-binding response regulator in two-component regulatory system with QseC [Cupriavidus metallidurans CH34]AVA33969.1 DNA-binding response regulator [Cupriavidus metallidurans]KWR86911.1 two-component system response regulator [Cupriavidus sp. SHE]KWW35208.1 Transcriptional regulatory protein QseB [Cupriavidus metallidurans]MDE4922389.1 response regulator [Cupriavidus metallidurans]